MPTSQKDQVMLLREALYEAIAAYVRQEDRYDEQGNIIPKEFFNALYHSNVVLFGNKKPSKKLKKLQGFVKELNNLGNVDDLSDNDAESIVTWINLSLVNFFTQTQESSPHDYSLVKYMIDKLANIPYQVDDEHPNWTNFDPERCKPAYKYDGYIPQVFATSSFSNEQRPPEPTKQIREEARSSNDTAGTVQEIERRRRRVYTSYQWAKSQDGFFRSVASVSLDTYCVIPEGSRVTGRVPRTGEPQYSYKLVIHLQGLGDLRKDEKIANFWVECHGNNKMTVCIERATHEGALTISEILSRPEVVTQLPLNQAIAPQPEIVVPDIIQRMRADAEADKMQISLQVSNAALKQ